MPRYTPAYSKLLKRLDEVAILQRFAQKTSLEPPTANNLARVNSLCRSGVVLLSSHVEGYIEDLGETAIDRIAVKGLEKSIFNPGFRYHLSRDLLYEFRTMTDPEQVASKLLALLARDGHIWDSNACFTNAISASAFVGDFANPTFDRICKFFRRFSYNEYRRDLARRLAANFTPCINMIDQLVDQRNKIAHGDMLVSGSPIDLAQMMSLVRLYCRETDSVVAAWFKAKGCAIR